MDKPEPICMSSECGRPWTRYFLARQLPKNFINKEYKQHRADVLFDIERAQLPASQETANLVVQKEQEMKELVEINEKIRELNLLHRE